MMKPGTPLAKTAWALLANTVATSLLGMAFWVGATRLYSPQQVGENAALVSAMILLSSLSQLNLSMGIARLLPQVAQRRARAVAGTYGLTAGVAVVLTACFLAVVPRMSEGLAFLGQDRLLQAGLVVAVILWNIFALQDAVLTSARWPVAVPVENAVFGLIKIGLMVWLANNGHGIFAAWVLAMAVVVLPVNALIFGKVLPARRRPALQPVTSVVPLDDKGRVVRYLATDYAAALLSQGSTALLPVLVVAVLGSSANAYFYVAFLISAAVGALAQSLSTSLIVEGAHDEANVAELTRRCVRRYATLVVPAIAVLIVAAPLVLRPFGSDYVAQGTTLLRLLLAGTVPQGVVALYLGVERVRARLRSVLSIEALSVAAVILGSLAGMRWLGLAGVGLAWLLSQSALAVVVLPRLARVVALDRVEVAPDADPAEVMA